MLVNPHVHTEQEILNSSFDETTGVLGVLPLEYDPSGATKRTVTGDLISEIDKSGTVTYIGEATPGSATSAAVWQITKIDSSSNPTVITYADGNANFDNIFDNRASLSYS